LVVFVVGTDDLRIHVGIIEVHVVVRDLFGDIDGDLAGGIEL